MEEDDKKDKVSKKPAKVKKRKVPVVHRCELCQKTFPYKGELARHMRIHTGDKPYNCDICSKSFTRKSHLNYHYRNHTGDKPFLCDVCDKSFSQKSDLNRHYIVHQDDADRPFKCTLCPKSFNYKYNLKAHWKVHTGEKPYTCDVCSKDFAVKSNLYQHRRTHTAENPESERKASEEGVAIKNNALTHIKSNGDELPYKCIICYVGFADMIWLKYHMLSHVVKTDKPDVCEVCIMGCLSKEDILKHIEEEHKDTIESD